MLLEHCYHALFNLFTCSEIQNEENKRLLEKKQRIDAIVASLVQNGSDEEQISEVQWFCDYCFQMTLVLYDAFQILIVME